MDVADNLNKRASSGSKAVISVRSDWKLQVASEGCAECRGGRQEARPTMQDGLRNRGEAMF
ncbi:hypothetical protein CH63R_13360 [Colletotrichum higginsianum IMI 349063]|uniref:Uncharacterized protein n=1 Tax=Colletotrichum higginsianum (strain IMI 349063) TaxID=759273 RepID=A0A1B7XWT5_COLHI|nr:hypothetical protein CH63R_13360 [Colletotrichum higginsianum IMI 349063]OBR04233.1 hypothetical protein CH63R_13360 [Colletotrichum higginsianum IMI 349063]GJD03402.1 hypothetical protein ColKHC_12227 [Colletotrichum higginsianum]